MIFIYNILLIFLAIFCVPKLIIKKKMHRGLLIRLGIENLRIKSPHPEGKTLWIHAVSVGEVIAVLPLMERILKVFPGHNIIFSVVTITGYKIAKEKLEGKAQVVYAPLDFSWVVKKYIKAIQPSVYIATETEIWPNLYRQLGKKNVPIIQVNGRISDKAYKGYSQFRSITKAVLKNVTCFCMRSELDAKRIIFLGASKEKVIVAGNLKLDSIPDTVDMNKVALGYGEENLLLIAGSTHPGEEDILIEVFMKLKPEFPQLNLVLAPRHTDRVNDIIKSVEKMNLRYVKYSEAESGMSPENKVLIVDTIGHLQALYGIADAVFVGKSLIAQGGQNMIEPIFFGKPTFVGPHTGNFRSIVSKLKSEDVLFEINGKEELLASLHSVLGDPKKRELHSQKAKKVVSQLRGATERTMKVIEEILLEK